MKRLTFLAMAIVVGLLAGAVISRAVLPADSIRVPQWTIKDTNGVLVGEAIFNASTMYVLFDDLVNQRPVILRVYPDRLSHVTSRGNIFFTSNDCTGAPYMKPVSAISYGGYQGFGPNQGLYGVGPGNVIYRSAGAATVPNQTYNSEWNQFDAMCEDLSASSPPMFEAVLPTVMADLDDSFTPPFVLSASP